MTIETKLTSVAQKIKENPERFKEYIFNELNHRRDDHFDVLKYQRGKKIASSDFPLSFRPNFKDV